MRRVCIILFLIISVTAFAREIEYTGQVIQVNTCIRKTTQVVFPANVKKIVTSFNQGQISIEVYGRNLYLQPLLQPQGYMFIHAADDRCYTLDIKNVPNTDMDVSLEVKPVATFKKIEPAAGEDKTIVHYMRMLITGDGIQSAGVTTANKIIYKDRKLRLTLKKIYGWSSFTGWVCEAKNLTRGAIVIPIQSISIPKLRAISADKAVLDTGEATNIYILKSPKK